VRNQRLAVDLEVTGLEIEERDQEVPFVSVVSGKGITLEDGDFFRSSRRIRLALDEDHILLVRARLIHDESGNWILEYVEDANGQDHIPSGWS